MAQSGTSSSSERVQRALAGQIFVEDLSGQERAVFFAGLAESMLSPSDAERAAYAGLGEDAPGLDEAELYGTSVGPNGLPPWGKEGARKWREGGHEAWEWAKSAAPLPRPLRLMRGAWGSSSGEAMRDSEISNADEAPVRRDPPSIFRAPSDSAPPMPQGVPGDRDGR
jgi:hypothetical protein